MNTKLPIIRKGYAGPIHFSPKKYHSPKTTLVIFLLAIVCVFAVLMIRLFQLTIVKGTYYSSLADGNRTREILIEPRRGTIMDRKGFVIVHNEKIDMQREIQKQRLSDRIRSKRIYETPFAIGSLVGYRQVADQNDLKGDRCLNKLQPGDTVGKKGVEKQFECDLRGRYGKQLVEVDANGKFLRTITVLPPQDGKTVQLALDWDLQERAYKLVEKKRAAIVVLKPQTGEILALVSTPTFNPQDFENINTKQVSAYLTDKDHPLFNRATEGTYPPGSVFKLVVAAGALEEKKIDERTQIEDTGVLKAGPLTFGNWYFLEYGKTEGLLDVVKAIKRSNDIFFYQTGARLGPEEVKRWAERFGYGTNTGSGLDEAEGLIPSAFWKEEALKEKWYLGDTYNLSIGQGYVLTTPLQVTQATATIANNGVKCTPKLLKNPKVNCHPLPISKKTVQLIQEGMKEACAPGGTGWPLFNFSVNRNQSEPISVSCKTGTAESYTKSSVPHAWFTTYAPSEKPEIVVTVLVEEAGQGSDIGGPIARDILKAYFERIQ